MSGQISAILDEMIDFLSVKQMKKLQQVLILHLDGVNKQEDSPSNTQYLEMFLENDTVLSNDSRTFAETTGYSASPDEYRRYT